TPAINLSRTACTRQRREIAFLATDGFNKTSEAFRDPRPRFRNTSFSSRITLLALTSQLLMMTRGFLITRIRSGCGKSTLLRIIGGLIPASDGELNVGNERVDGPHPWLGMVFQEESTFPWRTAAERKGVTLSVIVKRVRDRDFWRELPRFENAQNLETTAITSLRCQFGTSSLIWISGNLASVTLVGDLQRDAERQWIIADTQCRA